MPVYHNIKAQHTAVNFKLEVIRLMDAFGYNIETLAHCVGVSPETFRQWIDINSDRHMPAAFVPLLPRNMFLELSNFNQRQVGALPVDLNGMIEDEVTSVTEHVGAAVHLYRENKRTNKAKIIIEMNIAIEEMKKEYKFQDRGIGLKMFFRKKWKGEPEAFYKIFNTDAEGIKRYFKGELDPMDFSVKLAEAGADLHHILTGNYLIGIKELAARDLLAEHGVVDCEGVYTLIDSKHRCKSCGIDGKMFSDAAKTIHSWYKMALN